MLTSTLQQPSVWLSLLFVNQYVCLNSPGAGLQATPVSNLEWACDQGTGRQLRNSASSEWVAHGCWQKQWSIYVYGTMINWSTLIKKLMQTYIVKVSRSILNISTVHLNDIWHLIWCKRTLHVQHFPREVSLYWTIKLIGFNTFTWYSYAGKRW